MLIDKLKEKNITWPYPIKDAITFFVNEKIDSHAIYRRDYDNDITISSWLPFDNIAINFIDSILVLRQLHEYKENGSQLGVTILGFMYSNKKGFSPHFHNFFMAGGGESMGGGPVAKNEDGKYINVHSGHEGLPPYQKYDCLHTEELRHAKNLMVGVVSNFTHLLACKNIKYEEKLPPLRLQKARLKKRKHPLSSYYILKIKPTSSRNACIGSDIWTNRVHLCRGHVREYTEEKPLFGKLVGKYWIPPHVRGDKKQGMIKKDYQVV